MQKGPKRKDLTGRKFGRLVALRVAESVRLPCGVPVTRWWCRCDCGAEKPVNTLALMAGRTVSCGCYAREATSRAKLKPIQPGARFGWWTVLGKAPDLVTPGGVVNPQHYVRCECGYEGEAATGALRAGITRSCGCRTQSSPGERAVYAYVQSLYPDALHRRRRLLPTKAFQLDVYVPSLRAAIEYNGYRHYDFATAFRDERKREQCAQVGIRLLTIWDLDFNKDPDRVLDRVRAFLAGEDVDGNFD